MIPEVFFKIIIPNYNGMAYLKPCLDSILQQTFQSFRIVLVDDLSTDMSYELAKAYERKHPDKLTVLRAPEKKLAGGCRNIGIDWPGVKSKYTLFVDSDDFLNGPEALQKLWICLKSEELDVLIFDYLIFRNGKMRGLKSMRKFNPRSDNLANTRYNACWTKAIRTSKVEKFLEGCMRGEDTWMWLKVLDKHPKLKQVDLDFYVYRLHGSNTIFSKRFKEDEKAYRDALDKLCEEVTDEHVLRSIKNRFVT